MFRMAGVEFCIRTPSGAARDGYPCPRFDRLALINDWRQGRNVSN